MAWFGTSTNTIDSMLAAGACVDLPILLGMQKQAKQVDFRQGFSGPDLLSGSRLSRLRGNGLDFDELKNYQQGDDVRHMDWKVSLRTGRPHVRVFNEEKEQRVQLLIDQRCSMLFGSQGDFKSVTAAKLAALIGWQALSCGDRIASCVFADGDVYKSLSTRSTQAWVAQLQQWLGFQPLSGPQKKQLSIEPLLESMRWSLASKRRHQTVYLISDFSGLEAGSAERFEFEGLLKRLAEHNAVRCLFIYDPIEQSLPDVGQLPISDGQLHCTINTNSTALQHRFGGVLQEKISMVQDLSRQHAAIGMLMLNTVEPLLDQLKKLQTKAGGGHD